MKNLTKRQQQNGQGGETWKAFQAMKKIWAGTTWSAFARGWLGRRRTAKKK